MLKECLQFANDCLRWAAQAETQERRAALLKMGRIWMEAALRFQGVTTAQNKDRPQSGNLRRGHTSQ